jgi:hypothetical protein
MFYTKAPPTVALLQAPSNSALNLTVTQGSEARTVKALDTPPFNVVLSLTSSSGWPVSLDSLGRFAPEFIQFVVPKHTS